MNKATMEWVIIDPCWKLPFIALGEVSKLLPDSEPWYIEQHDAAIKARTSHNNNLNKLREAAEAAKQDEIEARKKKDADIEMARKRAEKFRSMQAINTSIRTLSNLFANN